MIDRAAADPPPHHYSSVIFLRRRSTGRLVPPHQLFLHIIQETMFPHVIAKTLRGPSLVHRTSGLTPVVTRAPTNVP